MKGEKKTERKTEKDRKKDREKRKQKRRESVKEAERNEERDRNKETCVGKESSKAHRSATHLAAPGSFLSVVFLNSLMCRSPYWAPASS